MTKKKLTYEAAYEELEQILQALQEEDIGLDSMAKSLSRAKELIEFCREKLHAVEEELENLYDEE